MSLTVADVIDRIAPTIGDGGLCADDIDRILPVLNEAQELLIKRLDGVGTLWYWCMPVWGGCFALPADCLEARQAWLDGKSMDLRDQWWEGKLSVGIQDRCCSWNESWVTRCGGSNLIDMGDGYPTPGEWPKGSPAKLALVAQNEGDAGKTVTVRYADDRGSEQQEVLTLLRDLQPVTTSLNVGAILSVHKEVTAGSVFGFVQYDFRDAGAKVPFVRYGPRVTNPVFRRKKIPGKYPCGCNGTLLVKGKRRFVPALGLTDDLQISDTQALKFACQALAAQLRKDPGEYNNFVALAVNELNKQLENEQARAATGQVQYKSPTGSAFAGRGWA